MLELSEAICVFKYEHTPFTIRIIDKWTISSAIDRWKSRQKVLRYMQDNKLYMLINKMSANLDIVGYLDIALRGVWILRFPHHVKSSPSHVELYCGKAPKLILMALVMMQTIMWHVKRLLGRLYVKQVLFPKLRW
jgi:hypothetical protein